MTAAAAKANVIAWINVLALMRAAVQKTMRVMSRARVIKNHKENGNEKEEKKDVYG